MKHWMTIWIVGLCAMSGSAHAWYFILLPGKAAITLADKMDGERFQSCVPESARVEDRIRLINGGIGTIHSIGLASSRCPQAIPKLAEVIRDPVAPYDGGLEQMSDIALEVVLPGAEKGSPAFEARRRISN